MAASRRNTTRARARVAGAAQQSIAGLLAFLLLTFFATSLVAQETLTLSDVIRIATENNPSFRQTENDQSAADWQVREAYGQLLPRVTGGGYLQFRESGVERVGAIEFQAASTDYYQSGYNLNFNWGISGSTLFAPASARAGSAATSARIDAAEFTLQQTVTLQYMATLRARDAAEVARETYERQRQNQEIVGTTVEAGFAAGTDGVQAEVDLGRAEVALLRAEQTYRLEKARLMETMGVVYPEGIDLVDEFDVFAPQWDLEALINEAMRLHPSLRAFAASERAQKASLRQAQTAYLPSLNLSTGISTYAQKALNDDYVVQQVQNGVASQRATCLRNNALAASVDPGLWQAADCSQFAYSDELGQQALARNTLSYDKNPIAFTLSVSVPVFSGFSRQRQVEQSQAALRDAQLSVQAEELRLRTAITQWLDAVESAYRAVSIESRNLQLAQAQLETARQRYQVGNTSILALMDAETSLQTAERDHLNAVYTFHQSLVALEANTGRSLRPGAGMDDEDGEGAEG